MIAENKVVTLNYTLRENSAQGLVLESTYEGKALEFIYGKANMMPSFEENIAGLADGSKFSFSIKSDDAYGEVNPSAVVDLDVNMFKVHDKIDYDVIKVGNSVPMQDSNGNRMDGLVIELTDDKVKMDFNHPLAGKDLFFEGEVIGIRDASEEELSHGHCHSEGGSCGSGGGHGHSHDDGGCGCGSGCGC
jgi:FKBP-type peptidyl-prolyl cis-trans isomerase SlyD